MALLSSVPPRRASIAILSVTLCAAFSVTSALALDTKLVQSGFTGPLFVTAPTDDSRLFVLEQGGLIKVRSGGVWSTFLDIHDQVNSQNERGLLGLAFDPNFKSNGTFYVDYIGTDTNTHIARFTVSSSNRDVANPTGMTLMVIPQPTGRDNHKAGWIGFRKGEDSNLYIATGDGGSANDPDNNAQTKTSQLGKILRINVGSDAFPADPNKNYAIPAHNPFALPDGAPEVWDYGLRNPYRNSFDRANGNLIIADVGQDSREEIDFESASNGGGNNYGWKLREGFEPTPGVGVDPVYDYTHGTGPFQGRAITGGYVYRGSLLKEIFGEYFFGDFISGRIWSMETDPATGALLPGTLRDRTAELKRLNSFGSISSFGEDGFGNLYIVDYSGRVFEIVPEPGTYAIILFALVPLAWIVRCRGGRAHTSNHA